MGYDFTPYDPVIWLIFAAFWVSVFVIVKIFHLKYPHYPKGPDQTDK